jgi:hypothetical protein
MAISGMEIMVDRGVADADRELQQRQMATYTAKEEPALQVRDMGVETRPTIPQQVAAAERVVQAATAEPTAARRQQAMALFLQLTEPPHGELGAVRLGMGRQDLAVVEQVAEGPGH